MGDPRRAGRRKAVINGSRAGLLTQGAILILLLLLPSLVRLSGYQLHIVELILVMIPLAIGLLISMGHCGQINLAQVALYGVGAYTTAILISRAHVDPWLATLAGTLAGGILGMVVGLPSLRIRGHYLAIATLGSGRRSRSGLHSGRRADRRSAGHRSHPEPAGDRHVGWTGCRLLPTAGRRLRRHVGLRADARVGSNRFRLRCDPGRPPCGERDGRQRRCVSAAGLHHQRSAGRTCRLALCNLERLHQPRLISARPDVLPAHDPGRGWHAQPARCGRRRDRVDPRPRGISAVRGVPAHHLWKSGRDRHAGRP